MMYTSPNKKSGYLLKYLSIRLTLLLTTFFLSTELALTQCSENCDSANNNTFFGSEAGVANSGGTDNTFIGEAAGKTNNSGSQNTFVGVSAGLFNTDGSSNSFFGRDAGRNNTSGTWNTFIGYRAGQMNTTGRFNTFIGTNAGRNNTQWRNSFLGYNAGESNTTGSDNSFFGMGAGNSNTTGTRNCFFGRDAGRNNTTGQRNTYIGEKAGEFNEFGSKNTFIGRHAGSRSKGSQNIFIGHGATPNAANEDDSFRLYIDVDPSTIVEGLEVRGISKPLIYGEFDNDFVRINGTFEVTAGLSNPSSRTLKEGFDSQDASEILDKLSSLEITKWNYKERPDEKHIGPVAEEFYALFGLGSGDKTISTIDADGIMMLAIQALKKENRQLRNGLKEVNNYNRKLEKRMKELEVQQKEQEALIQGVLKK